MLRLSAVAAFALAVCAGGAFAAEPGHTAGGHHATGAHAHVSAAGGIRAVHAWTQATSGRSALVFVEIENDSDQNLMLVGGSSANAASAALVAFELKDGVATYTPIGGMPIRAGHDLLLSPRGLALRLDGLDAPLAESDVFEMELEFADRHFDINVAVEAADATHHSHAGHSH